MTTIIIPPSGRGSLGDAALVAVARSRLPGARVVGLRLALALGARLARCERVVFIGADVLDGRYDAALSARRWALLRAIPHVEVVSASFGTDATPAAIEALPNARYAWRDPLSYANARAALPDATHRSTADLAFLAPQRPRAGSELTVGVVPNRLAGRFVRGDLVALHVEALRRLDGVRVVVFGHDRRGRPSDFALAKQIAQRAGAVYAPRPVACDVLVSGRLHAAIRALAGGTPALVMDYAEKVAGIGLLVDQPDLGFAPELLLDPAAFAQRIGRLIDSRATHRVQIAEQLPRVRELAQAAL